jgi:hypothetical protein
MLLLFHKYVCDVANVTSIFVSHELFFVNLFVVNDLSIQHPHIGNLSHDYDHVFMWSFSLILCCT